MRNQDGDQVVAKPVWFSVALRPQRPYGLLGTGSPGRSPRLSHSSRALWQIRTDCWNKNKICICHKTPRLVISNRILTSCQPLKTIKTDGIIRHAYSNCCNIPVCRFILQILSWGKVYTWGEFWNVLLFTTWVWLSWDKTIRFTWW